MTDSVTRTDSNAQLRRLGVAGRDVVSARGQIASILRSRIGRAAASLLAVAQSDGGDGDSVIWRAESGAHLTPVSSLSPERAQVLRALHQEIVAEIETLASQLDAEGDSGRLVSHLLRLALVTPDGYQALHASGDQPVLVNWGHAVEGQSIPEMDGPFPQSVAAASTTGKSPLLVAATAPAVESDRVVAGASRSSAERLEESRSSAWWIAWVLPLILLCAAAVLLWKLTLPLEPVVVERARPVPPPEDPVPAALRRLAALRSELTNAEAMRAELADLCAPVPESRSEPSRPEPSPGAAIVEPGVAPVIPTREEPPAVIIEPEPEPEPEIVPLIRSRRPPALPPEVPRVGDAPPPVALAPVEKAAPTLCEPGWTPTERPEVMVVVDGSGSMQEPFPGASSRLDAAKDAISGVVRSLHHEIRTGLVSFTDCGETSAPRKYGYRERPELLAQVRGLSASLRTSLANSIRRAGNAAKSVGPATVVVVSDGDDTCGGDPCEVARALKRRKPLLKINVIDLSDGRSAVLQCVADATGGRVFVPANALQMSQELQDATGQPDAGPCNP